MAEGSVVSRADYRMGYVDDVRERKNQALGKRLAIDIGGSGDVGSSNDNIRGSYKIG